MKCGTDLSVDSRRSDASDGCQDVIYPAHLSAYLTHDTDGALGNYTIGSRLVFLLFALMELLTKQPLDVAAEGDALAFLTEGLVYHAAHRFDPLQTARGASAKGATTTNEAGAGNDVSETPAAASHGLELFMAATNRNRARDMHRICRQGIDRERRGDKLYWDALDTFDQHRSDEAYRCRLEAHEDKLACTFHPEIGMASKGMTSNRREGEGFHEAGLAWLKSRENKLQKKRQKEEAERLEVEAKETQVPWRMSDASKKVLAARKKALKAAEAAAIASLEVREAEAGGGDVGTTSATPRKGGGRKSVLPPPPSFHPVVTPHDAHRPSIRYRGENDTAAPSCEAGDHGDASSRPRDVFSRLAMLGASSAQRDRAGLLPEEHLRTASATRHRRCGLSGEEADGEGVGSLARRRLIDELARADPLRTFLAADGSPLQHRQGGPPSWVDRLYYVREPPEDPRFGPNAAATTPYTFWPETHPLPLFQPPIVSSSAPASPRWAATRHRRDHPDEAPTRHGGGTSPAHAAAAAPTRKVNAQEIEDFFQREELWKLERYKVRDERRQQREEAFVHECPFTPKISPFAQRHGLDWFSSSGLDGGIGRTSRKNDDYRKPQEDDAEGDGKGRSTPKQTTSLAIEASELMMDVASNTRGARRRLTAAEMFVPISIALCPDDASAPTTPPVTPRRGGGGGHLHFLHRAENAFRDRAEQLSAELERQRQLRSLFLWLGGGAPFVRLRDIIAAASYGGSGGKETDNHPPVQPSTTTMAELAHRCQVCLGVVPERLGWADFELVFSSNLDGCDGGQ